MLEYSQYDHLWSEYWTYGGFCLLHRYIYVPWDRRPHRLLWEVRKISSLSVFIYILWIIEVLHTLDYISSFIPMLLTFLLLTCQNLREYPIRKLWNEPSRTSDSATLLSSQSPSEGNNSSFEGATLSSRINLNNWLSLIFIQTLLIMTFLRDWTTDPDVYKATQLVLMTLAWQCWI